MLYNNLVFDLLRKYDTPHEPLIKEFVMAQAIMWFSRVFTFKFWLNMVLRAGFVGFGICLAVAGYSPWLVVAYCWILGGMTLALTWRPKPGEHWQVEWKDRATLVYLYTFQVVILSAYRFMQLILDPIKLRSLAPELRQRADIVVDEEGYFEEYDHREWPIARRGPGYVVKVKSCGTLTKIVTTLGRAGSWVSIQFDEAAQLENYQRDKFAALIMGLPFIKQYWSGDYQLTWPLFSLSEKQLDDVEQAVRQARLFQGRRQDDK